MGTKGGGQALLRQGLAVCLDLCTLQCPPPICHTHLTHAHAHTPSFKHKLSLSLQSKQDPEKLQQLVSSVSTLAQNDSQLQAVTAELSTDVKQTVDTIREAESRAGSR